MPCQFPNDLLMLRILRHQRTPFRQLKIGEIKTRGYGASYQRILASRRRYGSKPAAATHHGLKSLSLLYVRTQPVHDHSPVMRDLIDQQAIPKIKMPELIRRDPVKSRKLPIGQ